MTVKESVSESKLDLLAKKRAYKTKVTQMQLYSKYQATQNPETRWEAKASRSKSRSSIFCGCSPTDNSISFEVINQTVENPIKINPNDGDISEHYPEIEVPRQLGKVEARGHLRSESHETHLPANPVNMRPPLSSANSTDRRHITPMKVPIGPFNSPLDISFDSDAETCRVDDEACRRKILQK